jgi:hypothetical protein
MVKEGSTSSGFPGKEGPSGRLVRRREGPRTYLDLLYDECLNRTQRFLFFFLSILATILTLLLPHRLRPLYSSLTLTLTVSMMTRQATRFTPEVLISAPRRSTGVPNSTGELVLYTVSQFQSVV